MLGRAGNDLYLVDNAADVVIEAPGEGSDRILTSVSYALRPGSEVELLTTTRNDGTMAVGRGGNECANTIVGNDGDLVDYPADVVIQARAEGNDRILTSVSYALRPGSEVELLTTAWNEG